LFYQYIGNIPFCCILLTFAQVKTACKSQTVYPYRILKAFLQISGRPYVLGTDEDEETYNAEWQKDRMQGDVFHPEEMKRNQISKSKYYK